MKCILANTDRGSTDGYGYFHVKQSWLLISGRGFGGVAVRVLASNV